MAVCGGELAAATSTGGVVGKQVGRVGDSAIVGAGTWAGHSVAVSMTGEGDQILAHSSARRIADLRAERGLRGAAEAVLAELHSRGAICGLLCVDLSGSLYALRNCEVMHHGSRSEGSEKITVF